MNHAYRDTMSYLLSSAVAGELTAVQNYTQMLSLTHSEEERAHLRDQAREEGGHVQRLQRLGKEQGFNVLSDSIEPEWRAIRQAFSASVERDDLISCLLIQEVMVETTAIVLYRLLSSSDAIDQRTRATTAAILDDELEHLESGVTRLRALAANDPESALRALDWSHDQVMPELASLATTDCDRLCDDLGVACSTLDVSAVGGELYDLRAEAAAHYVDTLYRVGFDPEEIRHVVDSISAQVMFGEEGRVSCC